MRYLLTLLVVFLSLPAFAHHTLQEALNMFSQGHVQKNLLLVKYKDAFGTPSFNKGLSTNIAYQMEPVFTRGAEVYQRERQALKTHAEVSHLENYFYFQLKNTPNIQEAQNMLEDLFANPTVEFAYFEPQFEVAVVKEALNPLKSIDVDTPTPSFESGQFYLQPAPNGVDAYYGWTQKGGTGLGVKVVDVEFGWVYNHEEFKKPFWTNQVSADYLDHGTAVWGEIASKKAGDTGVTGIAYDVDYGTAGMQWQGSWDQWFVSFARAFDQATSQMAPGSVIVIEIQGGGPEGKYVPMEYWEPMFTTIKLATSKGIIVVEAAGNGNANLDDAVYQGVFDLTKRDSGAIMVGAGAPPTPDQKHLERMYFSNYGSRVDVMGYGWHVTTAGYGDLFGGSDVTRQYTKEFSGTSSATPIVSGVVASLSGMAKAQNKVISPLQMRTALRSTGTPQLGNTAERIGNLPNVVELVKYFAGENAH